MLNFLVFFLDASFVKAAPLTAAEKSTILQLHNKARRETRGANMEEMVWDDAIAANAQAYANTCAGGHSQQSQRVGLGENLAWGWPSRTVESTMKGWVDEEKGLFQYGSDRWCFGGECKHYTQVVWASSSKLGCARTSCGSVANYERNGPGDMYVCHYGPQGNVISQQPYALGPPCSQCTGVCNNGLCISGQSGGSQQFGALTSWQGGQSQQQFGQGQGFLFAGQGQVANQARSAAFTTTNSYYLPQTDFSTGGGQFQGQLLSPFAPTKFQGQLPFVPTKSQTQTLMMPSQQAQQAQFQGQLQFPQISSQYQYQGQLQFPALQSQGPSFSQSSQFPQFPQFSQFSQYQNPSGGFPQFSGQLQLPIPTQPQQPGFGLPGQASFQGPEGATYTITWGAPTISQSW